MRLTIAHLTGREQVRKLAPLHSPVDPFLAAADYLETSISSVSKPTLRHREVRSSLAEEVSSAEGERTFVRSYQSRLTNGGGQSLSAGYTMMALLTMREGQYSAGIRLLERALMQDPDFSVAHCLMAKAYIALGRRTRAIQHLRKVLRHDPDDPWAQKLLYGPKHKSKPKRRKYCDAWEAME